MGYGMGSGFELYVQDRAGGDINTLQKYTTDFIAALNQRPEIQMAYTSFDTKFPQYTVEVDAARCQRAGITTTDVLSVLSGFIGGNYSSNLNRFSKLYRVMVQADKVHRLDKDALNNMFVRTSSGEMAPIGQFVTLTKVYGTETLTRFNLYNSIQVNGLPADGYSTGEAIAAIEEVAKQTLPVGYGYEFGGITREEAGSGSNTIIIFAICIIFVFLILCALYESIFVPLAVMLSVPFGLMGSFLFAKMWGLENNIYMQTGLIMLIGSNPEEAHPVIGMQIRQAVNRGCKLIVVDPRDIDLAKKADIHLKLRPGTNVAFANGIMHVIIEEGLQDQKFIEERTEGYEKIRDIVKEYTPERVAGICHIDPEDLRRAAIMYAKADRAPIIYCLGVTEHSTGTEGVMSMSNMALLVGKLGRPGCGVNPLRGQNNVQGACDMGAVPTDFPGYQKINTPGVVEKFEKAWGVPLNHEVGTHATDVFPKAIKGEIKGLYIYGEDPVVTDPDTSHVIKALESLDFFVVQELFMTETAKYADVILPGMSYAEKEGTFTNTERRVQRVRKAVTVDGDMRLDTDIIIDLMNRMGYPQPYLTSAQIMDEIASVTPSFAGISHARLDSEEVGGRGLQWPCTSKDHPGTPILHVGKFTRGLGWFYPAEYVPSAELPDDEYPIILMTGRILYHYTTRAMTGRTPELMEIEGKSFIEMNEEDAERLHISNGEKVRVSSRRGSIETTARVGTKTSPGESWMPFHFPDGNANWLTNAALDKYARIPEYKVCAVKIEKL